ncbi:MAG: hypothetical protein GX620_04205 [Chloroflexi bacterium]|nr:hypothetical protein [Chloroflexota bacterium]
MSKSHQRIIRASEIAQYIYCAHAWWLGAIEGYPSQHHQALSDGTAFHRLHGRQVRTAQHIKVLAYLLLGSALVIGLAGVWRLLSR